MHPYARLTPGPGFRPIRAALYYSQRVVIWPTGREAIARGLAAVVNRRQAWVSRAKADGTLEALREKGVAPLPDSLSRDQVAEVHDWLLPRLPTGSAAFPLESVLNCPHVLRIAGDPHILAIAGAYLGCKPTLTSIGIRWSLADKPSDVQAFHRDMDDWRVLKVFVYLTDVDLTSGPHTYVLGSHKTKARLRARPYQVEELEREYGRDALFRVVGSAGTSFIADAYGIHRGDTPMSRPRLLLQIQYSVLPNFSLLYYPVSVPAPPFPIDPYTSRLLLK